HRQAKSGHRQRAVSGHLSVRALKIAAIYLACLSERPNRLWKFLRYLVAIHPPVESGAGIRIRRAWRRNKREASHVDLSCLQIGRAGETRLFLTTAGSKDDVPEVHAHAAYSAVERQAARACSEFVAERTLYREGSVRFRSWGLRQSHSCSARGT